MKIGAKPAIVLSFAILMAFAGLIPLGRWHDEYSTLYHYHVSGNQFFEERLLHWSPRPLSELLAYAYASAVYRANSPLITEFLAPFWLALLGALVLPVMRNSGAFASASVLLALLFLGHPTAEVFYWPLGAVAYIPTIASAAFLLTRDWGDQVEHGKGFAWVFVALLVAASSSEVGALFTAIYVLLLLTTTRTLKDGRRNSIMVIPLILSLAVLYAQFTGRVAAGNEVFGDPSVAHHPAATAIATAKRLLFELLKGDSGHHHFALLISGIATKSLFFGGVYLMMSRKQNGSPMAQRLRLILAAASITTAALTLAAALYNFGSVCCERHATMRQEYVFIALGSLATYLAARWPSRKSKHAGTLLVFSLIIPLAAAIPNLKAEFLGYSETRLASERTWQSGMSAGPTMRISQTAPGPITGGLYTEPGLYLKDSKAKNDVPWMLLFFGKESAIATPSDHAVPTP